MRASLLSRDYSSNQEGMVDGKKKNNKSQYQKPTARTNANQDQEVSCGGAIDANNGRSSNRSAASPILDGRDLIYVSPTRVCVPLFSHDAAIVLCWIECALTSLFFVIFFAWWILDTVSAFSNSSILFRMRSRRYGNARGNTSGGVRTS